LSIAAFLGIIGARSGNICGMIFGLGGLEVGR
jgi:hypothetical protein